MILAGRRQTVMQQQLDVGPTPASSVGLFSFDQGDEDLPKISCKKTQPLHLENARQRVLLSSRNHGDAFASKLLHDVRLFKRMMVREEGKVDIVVLATKLSLVGYSATVRTAIGGGSACFRNLRHEFLRVRGDGDYAGAEYVVDCTFREHFSIPHPTPHYQEVLRCVPDEFVGSSSRLVPLVQCLCSEMAASFEARGLTPPPWRKAAALTSKWLPLRSVDRVCTCSSPPAHSPTSVAAGACAAALGRSSSSSNTPGGVRSSEDNVMVASAGGMSPDGVPADAFARVSDASVARRSSSGGLRQSLLTNKLGSRSSGSDGTGAAGDSAAAGVAAGGRVSGGSVSVQPPVHKEQPPTYRVKMPVRL